MTTMAAQPLATLDDLIQQARDTAPIRVAVINAAQAAVLTHGQMAFVVTNHLCDLMPGTGPEDASIVVAPLSHGAGIHQLAQVAHGVKTILPAGAKFDPDEIWGLVAKWKVTNLFTVPTIVKLLVEHPSVAEHDHASLRYMIYAGAPM